LADWEWVLGVNLWGVIHGVRMFVPRMLEQETEGHIVNSASVAGLISGPYMGIYKVTKHGVVALSETLYYELAERGAKLKVSVLCPGFVNTRIMESARNRPVELHDASGEEETSPEIEQLIQALHHDVQTGMAPQSVAEEVFNAIRAEKFYILTHPEEKQFVKTRMEAILQDRNPTLREITSS